MKFAKISTEVPAPLRRLLRNVQIQEKRRVKLIGNAVTDMPCLRAALDFMDHESGENIYSGSIKGARKALQRSARVSLPAASIQTEPDTPGVPVPCHVLRPSNCPSVLPGLVPRVPPTCSGKSVAEVLQEVEVMQTTGKTSFAILDHLHARAGIPWESCAKILRSRDPSLDDTSCAMAMAAREFWNRLTEFTRHYANAVSLRQVKGVTGEWAFVEGQELDVWLPGIHVPAMHRREQYLVRITSRGGSLLNLDFYSRSYLPLFRAPL